MLLVGAEGERTSLTHGGDGKENQESFKSPEKGQGGESIRERYI